MRIQDQIKCVEREIKMRERVYPRFIAGGKMTPGKAENEINLMRAVKRTLEHVLESQEFTLEPPEQ